MLSRKAKHLGLVLKIIRSQPRFFASLRFAQNDKLLYCCAETGRTVAIVGKSASLSVLVMPYILAMKLRG